MSKLSTPLCATLGIDVPIIQAPIGSATTPELAAAVSNAGGMGTLAMTWLDEDETERRLSAMAALTNRTFAINLVLAFPVRQKLERCLERGAGVIVTAWGDPSSVNSYIRKGGALHLHACGSVEDARQAADSGVDAVIAQGWEAGGHVLGTTASLALIPAVVDAVEPLPVIAAGGISDGRGLAAALVLGAQAAMLGTRFVASWEANAHEVWQRRIVAAQPDAAVHTTAFDGGWQEAPHRVLRNETLTRWEAAGNPTGTSRPGDGEVVAVDALGREWRRYDDIMPLSGMEGQLDDLAMYAGQSAGLIQDVLGAAEIVRMIEGEAIEALARY